MEGEEGGVGDVFGGEGEGVGLVVGCGRGGEVRVCHIFFIMSFGEDGRMKDRSYGVEYR